MSLLNQTILLNGGEIFSKDEENLVGNRPFMPHAEGKGLQPPARLLIPCLVPSSLCLLTCDLRNMLNIKIVFTITDFTISTLYLEMESLKVEFSCSERFELG